MGTVYRAFDLEANATCAVKVMATPESKPEAMLTQRFDREIRLLSQFQHPNIVRIFGASEHEGFRFYAMELIDGQSLEQRMRRGSRLAYPDVLRYGLQLCDALAHIHYHGVIHRDLKPANIMVSSSDVIKLTDFGIAKDVSGLATTRLTKADHTVGTVQYMSPEQLGGGELGPQSDLYSFGIVLYEMLCGRLPFIGKTMFEYMNQRMAGVFALPSAVDRGIPTDFDTLVKSLMAQVPAVRPRDATAVRSELIEIQQKWQRGTLSWREPSVEFEISLRPTIEMPAEHPSPDPGSTVDQPMSAPPSSAWLGSTPALVAAFVLLTAVGAYLLWPTGPEAYIRNARALMQSRDPADWLVAKRRYLDPLRQRFPDSPYAGEAGLYLSKIEFRAASLRAEKAVARGEPLSGSSEAEKQYVQARLAEKAGNYDRGLELCRSVVESFQDSPSEYVWVALARELTEILSAAQKRVHDEAPRSSSKSAIP
jgi:serine/threonine-protein kinase